MLIKLSYIKIQSDLMQISDTMTKFNLDSQSCLLVMRKVKHK